MTLRENLMAQAKQIAAEKAAEFDLAQQFGFEGDENLKINGRRIDVGTRWTVKTDLEDLTEDIRTFLQEQLPNVIFAKLLDDYLNRTDL